MLNRPTTLLACGPSFDWCGRGRSKHINYSVGMLVGVNQKGWPNWGSFVGQCCFKWSDFMLLFFSSERQTNNSSMNCRCDPTCTALRAREKAALPRTQAADQFSLLVKLMLHWWDQKIISMSSILLRTFHAFFLHRSRRRPTRAQPHVKCTDSPERGWLIEHQSLSGSPDKETLDYTPGSKCWIHTLRSRERVSRDLR